jgi:hypothetical protein
VELQHPTIVTMRDQEGEHEQDLLMLARSLAEIDVHPYRVLSLSLDVHWRDEQQRERVRLFVKDEARRLRALLQGSDEDEVLAADLERAEELVEDRIRRATSAGGLALFLCEPAGLEIEISCAWPLPEQLAINSFPAIRPLVTGLRAFDGGRALVAVVDSQVTHIYWLGGAGSDLVSDLSRQVPRRHKRGGWSQLVIQHHRSEQLDRHHREAAAELARHFDASTGNGFHGPPRLFLGGRREAIANLKTYLPPRILERAHEIQGLDPDLPDHEITERVDGALQQLLREEATHQVHMLEERAGIGMAVHGIPAVLEALEERRVSRLFMTPNLAGQGWRCTECGAIGDLEHSADGESLVAGGCPRCHAAVPPEPAELGELLVRSALTQHASVETLPGTSGLDRLDAIAAELRFPRTH